MSYTVNYSNFNLPARENKLSIYYIVKQEQEIFYAWLPLSLFHFDALGFRTSVEYFFWAEIRLSQGVQITAKMTLGGACEGI